MVLFVYSFSCKDWVQKNRIKFQLHQNPFPQFFFIFSFAVDDNSNVDDHSDDIVLKNNYHSEEGLGQGPKFFAPDQGCLKA